MAKIIQNSVWLWRNIILGDTNKVMSSPWRVMDDESRHIFRRTGKEEIEQGGGAVSVRMGSLIVDLGGSIGDWSSSVGWSVSVSWSMSVGNWGSDLGDGLHDSWGLSVDDSVESVDWVSGVGDSSDGTIGLNKGVLSLDDISVSALVGGLGVSGESVGNGVSVVVLWVSIVWLWGSNDGLGDWSVSDGSGDWGSISDWSSSVGWSVSVSWSSSVGNWGSSVGDSSWSSSGHADNGQDRDDLDHDE
jgi:hypothetical protein